MSEETTRGHAVRGPLRRDRRSKVIAGVCGGLGRHLDIDPVVFRILFAVLSFVGGIGLLAYAAAWLFVPQEGADRSEAHRMLTGSNPLLAVVVAIGLGLGTLAAISALTQGVTNMWPLWMIAAAVAGVLIWRGDIKLGRGPGGRTPEQPPTWWQQPVPGSQGAATGGGEPSPESGSAGYVGESGEPQDAPPPSFGVAAPVTAVIERPRRRGYGGLVLASLLAATGVLGVLDAAGLINLGWLSGGALVLVLLGAGMVIGGVFGKTTALVPVGLVVAVPLITLAAVGVPLHGTVGDENWTPASAAAVQPSYQLAVGDGTLDLSSVQPGAGKTVTTSAQVGIGDLQVVLPTDVNVVIHSHMDVGQVTDDGVPQVNRYGTSRDNGFSVDKNFTIPAQGKAQGTLVLDLKVGIGDVNIGTGD
ncbi:MAG TPA: PspC domain-containing protein [Actinospica sp.]|jgi:phage shock protein PspC (stress-responsive transcriptional regulator)|nr:PspC domain-containing protein [Actinospica sp.]